MTQPTVTPVDPLFHHWNSLSQYLGQARAVAHVAPDYVPNVGTTLDHDEINLLVDLLFAIKTLLDCAEVCNQKLDPLISFKGA